MIYRFRIAPSYKYSLLTVYSLAGLFAFNENFASYSLLVKSITFFLFAIFGAWLIWIWKAEIVFDDSRRVLRIGKREIPAEEIVDVEVKTFKVVFQTKGGVISFNYPVEDVELLRRLLRGVKT